MAKPLKGKFTSIDLGNGIRMDMDAIQLDHVNMHVLNGARGLVTIAMINGGEKLVQRVKDQLRQGGHQDSGELINSIRVTDMDNDLITGVSISVGTDVYYAKWVNDGTRGPIFAKTEPVMTIGGSRYREGKPHGPKVFVHEVKGQKPSQFFEKALRAAGINDFTRRSSI